MGNTWGGSAHKAAHGAVPWGGAWGGTWGGTHPGRNPLCGLAAFIDFWQGFPDRDAWQLSSSLQEVFRTASPSMTLVGRGVVVFFGELDVPLTLGT